MKKTSRFFSFFLAALISASFIPQKTSAEEWVAPSGIEHDAIGRSIQEYAAKQSYPSYRVCVFLGNEILYEGGDGYADKDNDIKTDEDTVYEWGSVTKTLTWVSVMQLYEQGRIDLNSDVRNYLPDGFVKRLKYKEPVTMLDLMNHTAGFEETSREIQSVKSDKIRTLPEALLYAEPKQVFHPGEVTAYSNWGAALAGYVVECVSGEDFADYVHKHIFEPAGMEHTSVSPDHSDNLWVKERREKIYSYDSIPMENETMLIPRGKKLGFIELYPAGSAAGTIGDLAKYGQALVSDDCPFFEKQETAELMFSPSSFLGDTDIPKNCHGFFPAEGAVRYMGHNGSTLGFSANLQFDRKSKLGCAVFVNQYAETALTAGIPELIFGKPDNSVYLKSETVPADISGTYIMSRGHIKNSLKALSYLDPVKIKKSGENEFSYAGDAKLRPIENRLIVISSGEDSALLELSGDGKRIYTGASELVKVKGAGLLHALIFVYIGIAAAGYIAVMTFWIMKILKKRKKLPGAALICSSHIAKAVSCICFIAETIIFQKNMGIPLPAGAASAAVHTVCVLLCAAAAVSDGLAVIKKKCGGSAGILLSADAAANLISAAIALIFNICII